MYTIEADNVAMALPKGMHLLLNCGGTERTRAGDCIVAPGPVMMRFRRPRERVVFSSLRDANPFFHLVESLWMLAGRDDAGTLNRYVADFGERFAESSSGSENWEAGGRIHGAYGHRWRHAHGVDQLEAVVHRLKKEPGSRQCVIQMWDCGQRQGREMSYGCDDLMGEWKDRPCNTHVYLRIRQEPNYNMPVKMVGTGHPRHGEPGWGAVDVNKVLDVTVCCRSNDIVWGLYGANAVHFSVLQEYLAARLGAAVGDLYVLSNNFHVYTSMIDVFLKRVGGRGDTLAPMLYDNRYFTTRIQPAPMFDAPDQIDADVARFFEWHQEITARQPQYDNEWFWKTATPVVRAHHLYKKKWWVEAFAECDKIDSADWRVACREWIERRLNRDKRKTDVERASSRV